MTAVKRPSKALIVCRHILGSRWFVSILAVLIAFAIGAILIAMTGASVVDAYYAMFRGAIFDPTARSFQRQIKPLTESLFFSIPLVLGGLGLALGFRAGLFNIGGKGQIIFGALAAVWVGFAMNLPPVVHTLVALLAAMVAGALYAGIAGVLKAKTGANEVIVTIMLNSIATLALGYILSKKSWQVPGSNQPQTPKVADSAAFTRILDAPFKIHVGLFIALLAVIVSGGLLSARPSALKSAQLVPTPKPHVPLVSQSERSPQLPWRSPALSWDLQVRTRPWVPLVTSPEISLVQSVSMPSRLLSWAAISLWVLWVQVSSSVPSKPVVTPCRPRVFRSI